VHARDAGHRAGANRRHVVAPSLGLKMSALRWDKQAVAVAALAHGPWRCALAHAAMPGRTNLAPPVCCLWGRFAPRCLVSSK
jgi:hypothetical protein